MKYSDLTGMKFGKLTVLHRTDRVFSTGAKVKGWVCLCACGNTREVGYGDLISGKVTSCVACSRIAKQNLPPSGKYNLLGRVFGRLTVIGCCLGERGPNGCFLWRCRCECGNEIITESHNLLRGDTKSCGCLQKEGASEINRLYESEDERKLGRVLHDMKQRCLNSSNKAYPRYGGRGIDICNEWLNDSLSFVKWAKEAGYVPGLTIDRIDNNGPYSPDNCRWTTMLEQQNNRACTKLLTVDGVTKSYGAWDHAINVCDGTVRSEVKYCGEAHAIEYIKRKLRERT